MSAIKAERMADIQGSTDARGIAIDHVGIRDLKYPITVLDPNKGKQDVPATIAMSVGLPANIKGTHMSRFIEVLNQHRGEITARTLPAVLHDLMGRLGAETARMQVDFPYFLERSAPVSRAKALMCYECSFLAETRRENYDFVLCVTVPVATLCPCSKAISDSGAHNQRGSIQIQVRSVPDLEGNPQIIWIEELVELAESSGSSPVYSLLKRPDERYVTMQAYDNPAFVEDIIRTLSEKLMADARVGWFAISVVALESIHNHNAFASIEWTRTH